MNLIFNELSLANVAPAADVAHTRMRALIGVIRAAARVGVGPALRTTRDFFSSALAYQYSVWDWVNDARIDRDLKLYFKTIAGQAPYVEGLLNDAELKANGGYEFHYNGSKVLGFGAGFLLQSPVVSVDDETSQLFKTDTENISVTFLNENAEVEEKQASVVHFSKDSHVTSKRDWILECLKEEIKDGGELWLRRTQYFPHLIFCQSTEAQIVSLNGNTPIFISICRHLFRINAFISSWEAGDISQMDGVKWSTESDTTLNNPALAAKRVFKCPDSVDRLFKLHTKPSRSIRIHFFPIRTEKIAYVGYVGDHLPI